MTLVKLAPNDHAEIDVTILDGSDGKVAYAWRANPDDAENLTIHDLLVLHDCDKNVMLAQPGVTRPDTITPFIGWSATGVGAHDLISVDPLHIEASVYWPSCCGIHGWIREGRWVSV